MEMLLVTVMVPASLWVAFWLQKALLWAVLYLLMK
jgi:hypothetical protein